MLSIKNITIQEKSGRQLLSNVTLEVKKGDYVAIEGSKAAAESLLLVLGGLKPVTSGEVYVDGIEISNYSLAQMTELRRNKFAYFLADSEIDPSLTVRENVELPLLFLKLDAKEIYSRVERAVQIVGMGDFFDIAADALSDWQINKLNLARMLVKNPEIMIVDEPLRVTDRVRAEEINGLFNALNKEGVTIIVASELQEILTNAKRRVQILADGMITELKKERAPRKPREEKPKTKSASRTSKKPRAKKEEILVENGVSEAEPEAVAEVKKEEEIPELDVKPVRTRATRKKKADIE